MIRPGGRELRGPGVTEADPTEVRHVRVLQEAQPALRKADDDRGTGPPHAVERELRPSRLLPARNCAVPDHLDLHALEFPRGLQVVQIAPRWQHEGVDPRDGAGREQQHRRVVQVARVATEPGIPDEAVLVRRAGARTSMAASAASGTSTDDRRVFVNAARGSRSRILRRLLSPSIPRSSADPGGEARLAARARLSASRKRGCGHERTA
jgi:hypothetical protein